MVVVAFCKDIAVSPFAIRPDGRGVFVLLMKILARGGTAGQCRWIDLCGGWDRDGDVSKDREGDWPKG